MAIKRPWDGMKRPAMAIGMCRLKAVNGEMEGKAGAARRRH